MITALVLLNGSASAPRQEPIERLNGAGRILGFLRVTFRILFIAQRVAPFHICLHSISSVMPYA